MLNFEAVEVHNNIKSGSLDNKTKGIFKMESLMMSDIKEGTVIIANVLGIKNPLNTTKPVNPKTSLKWDLKENYFISLGKYYCKIGNKKMLTKMINKKSNDSNIREIEKL